MDAAELINHVFFAHAETARRSAVDSGNRFVHYTQAETALGILRTRKIWLRNARLMNDFSEIAHGFECLSSTYRSALGRDFQETLAALHPDLPNSVSVIFDTYKPALIDDTHIFCMSAHHAAEDTTGRLAMWRAYGGRSGVALVFYGTQMHLEADSLGAVSSPVAYLGVADFAVQFGETVARMKEHASELATLPLADLRIAVINMFRFAVLCTKHPGFRDEREWRVLATPSLYGLGRLQRSVECVGGVPQHVLKLPLENVPEENLVALALPDVLDRVIVGPCEYPEVVATAFRSLLESAGVTMTRSTVVVSDIPLRHNG